MSDWLVCVRVEDLPTPVKGSAAARCEICRRLVWRAPEQVRQIPSGARVSCTYCVHLIRQEAAHG